MPRAGLLAAAAVVVAALVLPGRAAAAAPLKRCAANGLLCGSVVVPLDYSGAVPGQIALHVEELPSDGPSRGVAFLVAGGPGQASARVYDLAHDGRGWQDLIPGYTLVAYDDRGTGSSGALSCPGLDDTSDPLLVAACAANLGAAATYYSTVANAQDMESIRQALGIDRIAIYGVSYGTKQAVTYALLHPAQVDRLVLDSVRPPEGSDPFGLDRLRAIPRALGVICRGGACTSLGGDPVGEFARLTARLEAHPINLGPLALDGRALVDLAIDTDLSRGTAAELPWAVASATAGRMLPLERLLVLDRAAGPAGPTSIDDAAFVATLCNDGPFPWTPDEAPADRQGSVQAAIAALPAGATGPFGAWATVTGTASMCAQWPTYGRTGPLPPDPLPDVPVLVLSGERDVRTPLEGAASVAARFPHGRLFVGRGVGHDVSFASPCLTTAVVNWWLEGDAGPDCPRLRPTPSPLGRMPTSLGELVPPRGESGRLGKTVAAVEATLREARRSALFLRDGVSQVPGLDGGWLRLGGSGVTLSDYSDVPGVTLTGAVDFDAPLGDEVVGTVRVGGPYGLHGVLYVEDGSVDGKLAGRAVSVRATF